MSERLNIAQNDPDHSPESVEIINENRVDRVTYAVTEKLAEIANTLNKIRAQASQSSPEFESPAKQFGQYVNTALFDESLSDPTDQKLAKDVSLVLMEIYFGVQRGEYESVTEALQQCIDLGSLPKRLVNDGSHYRGAGVLYTLEMKRVLQYLADDKNLDNIHLPT